MNFHGFGVEFTANEGDKIMMKERALISFKLYMT